MIIEDKSLSIDKGGFMKSTGMIRNIDALGRIVLPKELRQNLRINIQDPLEIFEENESIILRKYEPFCILCGSGKDITLYKSKKICKECIKSL